MNPSGFHFCVVRSVSQQAFKRKKSFWVGANLFGWDAQIKAKIKLGPGGHQNQFSWTTGQSACSSVNYPTLTAISSYLLIYSGISQGSVHHNAATQLIMVTKSHDPLTTVLASLHWLPDRFRVDFKITYF